MSGGRSPWTALDESVSDNPAAKRGPSGELVYFPGQPYGLLDGKPFPVPTSPGAHFVPLPPGTTVTNILGGRATSLIPKESPMPQGGVGGQSKSMKAGDVYKIMGVPSVGGGVQNGVNKEAVDMVAPDGTIIQFAPAYRRPYPNELKVWMNKKK